MRVYISGPMTGVPDFNYPAFNRVADRLDEAGFEVLNPARHGGVEDDATWADYMRLALVDLASCDGVCALPGWERSAGATLEVHIAELLGMPVLDLMGWRSRSLPLERSSA